MIRSSLDRNTSAFAWFKSSYSSSGDGNDCVEVAITPTTIHIRDSKSSQGPRLAVASGAWVEFVAFVGG
ncbi:MULTISPECIES: DUF397 domain-containing protein [unclassified Streptomyces]|uniref:DUF397 domain-containing protein n=1 Tax=unclassified Streptomyces TaxID=2593676 RepID=UPI0027417DAA|nr:MULTISPECIES: DUF397 domain-containing protein [unclassified Streptomyces]